MKGLPSKCKSPTHFFKFIPPGCISKMSVPISFRKYLESMNNNKTATLKRGCRKWRVKIEGDWVFGDGWGDFVKENGVQELDFVVFKHEGNMVFETMVFDTSWCEKECPSNDQVTEKKAEKACLDAKSRGKCKMENAQTSPSVKFETGKRWTRSRAEAEHEGASTSNKRIKSNTLPEKDDSNSTKKSTESILKAEKTENLDPNHHPYFTGTLKSEQILYLPASFSRANGLSVGKMTIRNGQSQKSWKVELKISSGNFCRIVQGWRDFYIANGLKEGDHFKLELVKNGINREAIFYQLPKGTRNVMPLRTYPSFKSTATAYSIKSSLVTVPNVFARLNRLDKENCEIVIMDEKQRHWQARLHKSGRRIYISGLRSMWDANGITEGDGFLLELVRNGKKPRMNFKFNRQTKAPVQSPQVTRSSSKMT